MVGTRGGVGRIAAMAIALAVGLVLLLASAARAGTYNVAQCGWGVGAELDPTAPRTEGVAAFLHPGYCTTPPPGSPAGLWFETGFAADGTSALARARWAAPPGTNFAGVRFTWSGELPLGFWQLAAYDNGVELNGLIGELLSSPPHTFAASITGPAPAFEVKLECLLHGEFPATCHRSQRASLLLSAVTLTVADPVPPRAKVGGALVAAGWHRGTVPLEITSEDAVGAGVASEDAAIDGARVFAAPVGCAVATIEGEVRGTSLRPCPPTAAATGQVDTTKLVDGVHTLQGCATDFGGGRGCAADAQIEVDNSAPEVDFSAAPEGQVAATVSDPFSGPAAGTISVRPADSETWRDLATTFNRGGSGTATLSAQLPDLSAGAYFFRATATDAAGNAGSAQFRAAGTPDELRRAAAAGGEGIGSGPAPRGGGRPRGGRGGVAHLVAHLAKGGAGKNAGHGSAGSTVTVDYGVAAELRGRLTDGHGAGIAGRAVIVVVRAAARSGGAPGRRRVVTDRGGRFALRLGPGVSRAVAVAFHGGGGFAPAHARPLALRVRAGVSLAARPSRLETGESVTLSGRVRPGPARIPARGKLVTIQYLERASGRWRPALVVRTDARGHFEDRYRFRYVTGDARIRLRATALPEAGWPYASGSSAPVSVEVRGG